MYKHIIKNHTLFNELYDTTYVRLISNYTTIESLKSFHSKIKACESVYIYISKSCYH